MGEAAHQDAIAGVPTSSQQCTGFDGFGRAMTSDLQIVFRSADDVRLQGYKRAPDQRTTMTGVPSSTWSNSLRTCGVSMRTQPWETAAREVTVHSQAVGVP